jgi:hypothetical protein
MEEQAASMQVIANVTDRLKLLAESLRSTVNRFQVNIEDTTIEDTTIEEITIDADVESVEQAMVDNELIPKSMNEEE